MKGKGSRSLSRLYCSTTGKMRRKPPENHIKEMRPNTKPEERGKLNPSSKLCDMQWPIWRSPSAKVNLNPEFKTWSPYSFELDWSGTITLMALAFESYAPLNLWISNTKSTNTKTLKPAVRCVAGTRRNTSPPCAAPCTGVKQGRVCKSPPMDPSWTKDGRM